MRRNGGAEGSGGAVSGGNIRQEPKVINGQHRTYAEVVAGVKAGSAEYSLPKTALGSNVHGSDQDSSAQAPTAKLKQGIDTKPLELFMVHHYIHSPAYWHPIVYVSSWDENDSQHLRNLLDMQTEYPSLRKVSLKEGQRTLKQEQETLKDRFEEEKKKAIEYQKSQVESWEEKWDQYKESNRSYRAAKTSADNR